MEYTLCSTHQFPCMLKTGQRPGPNFGKSFYICGHSKNPNDRCSFVKEANGFTAVNCGKHSECPVELQAMHFGKHHSQDECPRIFYRCAVGKSEKKNWCGEFVSEDKENIKQNTNLDDFSEYHEHRSGKGKLNEAAHAGLHKDQAERSTTCDERSSIKSSKCTVQTGNEYETVRASQGNTDVKSVKMPANPIGLQSETSKTSKEKATTFSHKSNTDAQKEENKSKANGSHISSQPKIAIADTNSHKVGNHLPQSSKPPSFSDFIDKTNNAISKSEQLNSSFQSYRDSTPQKNKGSRQCEVSLQKENKQSDGLEKVTDNVMKSNSSSISIGNDNTTTKTIKTETHKESTPTLSKEGNAKTDTKNIRQCLSKPQTYLENSDDDCQIIDILPGPHTSKTDQHLTNNETSPKLDTYVGNTGVVSKSQQNTSYDQSASHDPISKSTLLLKISKKASLANLLDSQKRTLQSVNRLMLPDGGSKIRSKIEELTEAIAEIDLDIKKGQTSLARQDRECSDPMKSNEQTQIEKLAVCPHCGNLSANYNKCDGCNKLLPKPIRYYSPKNATSSVKTASGQVLHGTKQMNSTTLSTIPNHEFKQMYASNPQAMTLYGGRMTKIRLEQVTTVTSDALEELHNQLRDCPSSDAECEDPRGLKVNLMTHQRQALRWLLWREKQRPPGGILADDMGLGKTLTTIALILHQKQAHKEDSAKEHDQWISSKTTLGIVKSQATLVVCPASVVHQWEREIDRRCKRGRLDVIVYHGAQRETDVNKVAAADVVLTTFALIGREVGVPDQIKNDKSAQEMAAKDGDIADGAEARHQPLLLRIAWSRIVLDEAHNIKNHKSLTALATCRLRAGARWALTGTPIQNDLLDMYSLLRYLRCSPFDEYKVWKRQVDNRSEKGKQRLNTLIRTLLLRRTKDQTDKNGLKIVSLPERHVYSHEIHLSGDEKCVYDNIFKQSRSLVQQYIDKHEGNKFEQSGSVSKPPAREFTPASSVSSSGGMSSNSGGKPQNSCHILLLLLRLRQCCGHLHLMAGAPDVEGLQSEGVELDLAQQMTELSVTNSEPTKQAEIDTDTFDISQPSSKITVLLDKMSVIRKEGSKAVVVSQWTKMLDVASYHLQQAGYRCCNIRGNIPPKQRSNIVDEFNDNPKGPEVLLLSLRAGGVGLNLIGGNHLFLLDMHWNPALEAQAFDRIYRVGQKKDVSIHKFVCKETVEEKIHTLQETKMKLAKNVLSGDGPSANKLTLNDLKMLFGLDQPSAGSVPRGAEGFYPASR